jgi:alkanesulfonate monooxygenase SsuD/methylene tetrahydromethanopterin reductase-like flavin-dependent oxidoreductase (luciferase family)
MPNFNLSFDMRVPDMGTSPQKLYAEALEMSAYADSRGMAYATVMEHHGAKDGYLPSPFVMGAAIAARTQKMRILLGAIILPLHDPVKVAEQIAVLDLISNGRVDVVLGAGYVRSEFDMFRASLHERGKALDAGIPIIQRALAGERFSADGREIFVRPLPVQKPFPPLLLGGGVAATAQRAARFGTGLYPMKPEIIPIYKQECAKAGREPARIVFNIGWIHLSEDPDRTWNEVAPHVLHVAKSYAEWTEGASSSSPFEGMDNMDALKASGIYHVVTPDQCVKMAAEADKIGADYGLAPIIGGLDPKIGWKSLELLLEKVLPRIQQRA